MNRDNKSLTTMHYFAFGTMFVVCALPWSGWAQGICVIPTLKISSIKGRVLSNQEGVPQSNIELRSKNESGRILRKLLTDEEGKFDIHNIANGKYLLVVSRELFSPLHIPIDLKFKGRKKQDKLILIHLAPDYEDPCSEGAVEITSLVLRKQSADKKSLRTPKES